MIVTENKHNGDIVEKRLIINLSLKIISRSRTVECVNENKYSVTLLLSKTSCDFKCVKLESS